MSTNVLEQLETTQRTVKRAQYEALEFALAPNGIQVRNNSHANPTEHEYLVTVSDGAPTSCTCPADEKYSGACKHRIAIAIRRPILDAVRRQQLVADGGIKTQSSTRRSSESEDGEDDDRDCDCADLSGDFPCWECYRSGRRDLPSE
jgi:hypothetical protein